MSLRFLGKDPFSKGDGSPTLYEDGDTYVFQGWKVFDLHTLVELGELPEWETVIRFPKRMMRFFPEVDHVQSRAPELVSR